jgi:hypothetical protein
MVSPLEYTALHPTETSGPEFTMEERWRAISYCACECSARRFAIYQQFSTRRSLVLPRVLPGERSFSHRARVRGRWEADYMNFSGQCDPEAFVELYGLGKDILMDVWLSSRAASDES